MNNHKNKTIAKRVIWWHTIGILFMATVTWVTEILDIPYVLLGGPSTPINWRESIFESLAIIIVGALIVRHTYKLLNRLNYLENMMPACASCQQVRIDPEFWQSVEKFIKERSKTEFTHGICPDCIEKYYPELAHPEKPSPAKKPLNVL
ncbi:hypothetical protein [Desulfobulbus alkaliphilus]|uniref:hypothetical protein n=1 Tax=Desulfobulbus alkaliphilus TaxID=869814 RepID=UPI001963F955|nr:hypothetical protein [Desulfobulbus alkaliphilus]MBM9537300.1 hypothetical protein [Desulfobulbus alkaliphilus]